MASSSFVRTRSVSAFPFLATDLALPVMEERVQFADGQGHVPFHLEAERRLPANGCSGGLGSVISLGGRSPINSS